MGLMTVQRERQLEWKRWPQLVRVMEDDSREVKQMGQS